MISETVNFGEAEETTDKNNENTTAEIIDETEELKGKDENEEFEIEIPDEEETVDAEEIGEKNLAEQLVEEHGEFDPKADLEGYLLPLDLLEEYGSGGVSVNKEELRNKDRIIETLSNYKIDIAKNKSNCWSHGYTI